MQDFIVLFTRRGRRVFDRLQSILGYDGWDESEAFGESSWQTDVVRNVLILDG